MALKNPLVTPASVDPDNADNGPQPRAYPWPTTLITLRTTAVLAMALATVPAAEPGSLTSSQLRAKALRIQALVETKTLQAHGLIPMFVRATDYALPSAADYATMAPHRHMRDKKEADIGMPPMFVSPSSDGAALPSDWKTEGELLDHDSLTGWLLAYWEGSWRGYW